MKSKKPLTLSPRDRLIRMVLAVLLFVLLTWGFIFASGSFYRQLSNAHASLSWPKIAGVVVNTREKHDIDGCEPIISYQYTVAEEQFENNRIRYINSTSPITTCYDVDTIFPKGRKLDVYYDPLDPNKSVLVPGDFSHPSWMLIPAMMILICFILGFLAWKMLQDYYRVLNAHFDGTSYQLP